MSEYLIVTGPKKLLPLIITNLLATHQMIYERDIGEFVGQGMNEHVRSQPQALKLKLLFYSVQNPPWRPPQGELVRATYNVPFLNKAKINWTTIKSACGGDNGYMWGRFRCTANISDKDGNIRQMQVYGASENEAEQRLKTLLTLSEGQIVTLTNAEEKKEGKRATDKLLYKESTRVYPAYFTLVNSKKIIAESHNATLSGNYYRSRSRVALWTDSKPPDADEIIQEAFKIKGSSAAAG